MTYWLTMGWLYFVGAVMTYNTFGPAWERITLDPTKRYPWIADIMFSALILGWPVLCPLMVVTELWRRARADKL